MGDQLIFRKQTYVTGSEDKVEELIIHLSQIPNIQN